MYKSSPQQVVNDANNNSTTKIYPSVQQWHEYHGGNQWLWFYLKPIPQSRTRHTWDGYRGQDLVSRVLLLLLYHWDIPLSWLLVTFHYTHRFVYLLTLKRETSFGSVWWLTQRQLLRVQGINMWLWNVCLEVGHCSLSHSLLPRFRDCCKQRGAKRAYEPGVIGDYEDCFQSRIGILP